MKDENNGAIKTEFVGFRAKMYPLRVDGKKDTKKVKGVKEKAQAAEEAERRKKLQEEKEANKENGGSEKEKPASQEETKNVLGDEGDEDLIF